MSDEHDETEDWDSEDLETGDADGGDDGQAIRIPLGHPPVLIPMPGSEGLAETICASVAWKQGKCQYTTFANGEISVRLEQSVANHDVFVLCLRDDLEQEINFTLMQLLLLIASIRGESAYRVTVVFPCLEYARQDRRVVAGEAIPPRLLLRCMHTAGATRFVCLDLHNQAEAAFSPAGMVLDELSSTKYLAHFIRENVPDFDPEKVLVCSTNGGGMKFTRAMADELRTGFMMADRFRPRGGGVGSVKILGDADASEAEGIIVVDDMFDTCGSLAEVVTALHAYAPRAKLYAIGPHGYFSKDAAERVQKLANNQALEWIAVTNSIAPRAALQRFGGHERLKIIDISKLLAGAVMRIHVGESINLPKFRAMNPDDVDPHLPIQMRASAVPHNSTDPTFAPSGHDTQIGSHDMSRGGPSRYTRGMSGDEGHASEPDPSVSS